MIGILNYILISSASLLEECSPLMRETNSLKRQQQIEELAFLEKPLKNVSKWNETFVQQKNKLKFKSGLAYDFLEKSFIKADSSRSKYFCQCLINISSQLLELFGEKKNVWITDKYILELQQYVLDPDIYKELNNLKGTIDFFTIYSVNIKKFVEKAKKFDFINEILEIELPSEDNITRTGFLKELFEGRTLVQEVFQIIHPTEKLLEDIAKIQEVLKGIQRNKTGLFF